MMKHLPDIENADGSVILPSKDLEYLADSLREIRFGSVTLTVRNGQVTGIERNEKIRLGSEKRPKELSTT